MDDNASSLSLENLGGSQNNLSLLGRNPDKEMRIHTGRRSTAELNNSVSQLHSNQNQISTENQAVFDSPRGETPNNDRYLDNREVEEMERRQRESMSPLKSQYVRLSGNYYFTNYQNFAAIWQVFLSFFAVFCHKFQIDIKNCKRMEVRQRESMSLLKFQYVRLSGYFLLIIKQFS